MTSNSDLDDCVTLVGCDINCVRLNEEQNVSSATAPGSSLFSRLQFKSPRMKIGLFNESPATSELFNSFSKVRDKDESGGLYTVHIINDRSLRICILSQN